MKSKMRDAIPDAAREPSVSPTHLAAAIRAAAVMNLKEKEQICDQICAAQPNLLGSVLAQASPGVSMATVDVLLNLLIVVHLAVENSGQVLASVSEDDLERELKRFTAAVRFTEGLEATSFSQSVQRTTAYRREKFLLAYAIDTMQRAGLVLQSDENMKIPVLVGINLVNCIATAKRSDRHATIQSCTYGQTRLS
jgi:hypothetical protein